MKRRRDCGSPSPRCSSLLEEVGQLADGLERDALLAGVEHRLAAGQEEQRRVAVGQLVEVELDPRRFREPARLPDLEALEGAEHHVLGRGYPLLRVGGLAPVVERLLAMLCEPPRLAGRLHLDDADAGPDQVDEAPGLKALELGDVGEPLAVAVEELGEESLGLAALISVPHAPARDEPRQVGPDLLAAEGHPGPTRTRGAAARRR